MESKITDLKIGKIDLYVKDLEAMKSFYRDVLILDILDESEETVIFGKNGKKLVSLNRANELSFPLTHQAGLYHFAILFASRGDLARTVYNILKSSPESFSGTGDHLVSEAFYFYDPEGNGIELYYDRERASWLWENGHVKMATLYIDPKEYLQRYIELDEEDAPVTMGHIHLKVGDIEKAEKFYVEVLGFEITARLPQALFVSIGGYHHHIGINSWESFGATERDKTLGLKSYELVIKEEKEIEDLKKRLDDNNINFEEIENGISFMDPWKNQLLVRSS